MPDPAILSTIDALADLQSDASALRGWLARVQCGCELTDRDRAAISRHVAGLRDHSAAVLHRAALLGFAAAERQVPVKRPSSAATAS